jgi:hypothetical protein
VVRIDGDDVRKKITPKKSFPESEEIIIVDSKRKDDRRDKDAQCIADACPKEAIIQQFLKVAEPNEAHVRAEAAPVIQTVDERLEGGHQKEGQIERRWKKK